MVWRRGIDLAPVDLHDPDAVRWLECCIWPDQPERLARLPAVWISAEGPGVVPALAAALEPGQAPEQAVFLLGQGPQRLVGLADPHGTWLQWLDRHPASSS